MSGETEGVKETPQQRAMVDLALNKVADFKRRWLPVQRNLAESIASMGKEGSVERRAARGVASTSTEASFSGARQQLEAGLATRGALGSSKGKLAMAGLAEDQATSAGLGATQAEQQIDDAYTQGLGAIMALGTGQRANATRGVTQSAGLSGQRAANDAQMSLDNRMGNAQLGAQFLGMGVGLAGTPSGGSGMTVDPSGYGIRPASSPGLLPTAGGM